MKWAFRKKALITFETDTDHDHRPLLHPACRHPAAGLRWPVKVARLLGLCIATAATTNQPGATGSRSRKAFTRWAHAAQENSWEAFPFFAAAVIVCHMLGVIGTLPNAFRGGVHRCAAPTSGVTSPAGKVALAGVALARAANVAIFLLLTR